MDGVGVKVGWDRGPNDAAWMVVGNLIAGMAIYGGLGWLLGRWLGNQSAWMAVGFVFGLSAGVYLVYVRMRLSNQTVLPPGGGTHRRTPIGPLEEERMRAHGGDRC